MINAIQWRETASGTAKRFAIVSHALRNTIVGGNLTAARFIAKPRTLVSYVNECLFLSRLLDQQDGLPQVPVWKGLELPVESDEVGIAIFPEAAEEWFRVHLPLVLTWCRCALFAGFWSRSHICDRLCVDPAHWTCRRRAQRRTLTLDLGPTDQPSLSPLFSTMTTSTAFRNRSIPFCRPPGGERIHCLCGESAMFDFSPWLGEVDLGFFIDGALYYYVRNDTPSAHMLPLRRRCGWHDYGRAGIDGARIGCTISRPGSRDRSNSGRFGDIRARVESGAAA